MKSLAVYYKVRTKTTGGQNAAGQENAQAAIPLDAPVNQEPVTGQDSKDELHVNIWKVNEGRLCLKSCFYLDIGLKVSFAYESVRLYLPFAVIKQDPIDLCKTVMENRKLLCAIFNDEMLPTPQTNPCFCKVTRQTDGIGNGEDSSECFYLYQIDDNNNIDIQVDGHGKEKGTWVTVTMNGTPTNDPNPDKYQKDQLYIRFRLKVTDRSQFRITESISNDLIQAAFSRTDLFDLRINELREIDGKVLERMKTDNFSIMSFKKVHVFYITDTRESVVNGSSLKVDSRLLEKGHWIKYEPANSLHGTHYVAHHWKRRRKEEDKENIRSFSVFFSTQYPRLSLWRLLAYISVVILLGWSGSMLSFDTKTVLEECPAKLVIIVCCIAMVAGFLINENIGIQMLKIFRKR